MNEALLAPRPTLGRYEILGEIAQGAMGVVYKARDPLIDRIVAIKTVQLGLSDAETEAYERRFFREAKSAGRLNHPNVVTIHDVGRADDIAYIAMEFLDGQSLRDLLDSGVVLPPQRVADIAAEIAEGLAFAHENGVVHRDVKPANIMVLGSGAVKITDFGIALLPTGTRTMSGNAFGSPRYTSPEQVMGRPVDGRSDIFSLGATVYEMLTGTPPFTGGDLNTILRQVLSDPTPPPSSVNPRIPRAFDHIVGKALAKDPADRYQTAEEMAHDLRRFDATEFATPAPAPLPALEHATAKFSARDLSARPTSAPVPIVTDPAKSPLAATGAPPWWQQRIVMFGALATVGAIALGMAVVPLLRKAPAAPGAANVAATKPAPAAAITQAPTADARPAANATASAALEVAAAPKPAPSSEAKTSVAPPETKIPASPPPATGTVIAAAPAAAATPAAAKVLPPAPATAVAAAPAAAPAAVATPVATKPAATPAPVPPKPTGTVAFAIAPWGEIWVDGRRRGMAPPLQELKLPAGKHTVEVRNATFPPYTETIEIAADGVVRLRHKFQ